MRLIVLTLLLTLFFPFLAPCDQITLKNGNTLMGIIESENEQEITLHTEVGQIVLPRALIKNIETTSRANTHQKMGESLLQAGRLDAAEAEFKQALNEPDGAKNAESGLQRVQSRRKQIREQEIADTVKKSKRLVQSENFQEATSLLTALLDHRFPNDPVLLRERGEIRLLEARYSINHLQYERAKNLLVLAGQDGGSQSNLHYLLALIDRREGRLTQAIEEYRIARTKAQSAELKIINAEMKEAEAFLAKQGPALRKILPSERPSQPAGVLTPELLWGFIERAGSEFGVDPLLIEAIITAESGFQPEVVSRAGAQGLMQLLPGTAKDMGVEDPFDPEQNVRGGTRYMALMLKEFDGNVVKALAAYNAGPHKVKIYRGVPPYKETQNYIPKVLNRYDELKIGGSSLLQTG